MAPIHTAWPNKIQGPDVGYLNNLLTKLVNSGPAGFTQAVRMIQDLSTTPQGMKALKAAYQLSQLNAGPAKSKPGGSYKLSRSKAGNSTIQFGDGMTGKRMPSSQAQKVAESYRYGSGSSKR